jgi:TonB family protein
MEKKNKRNLLLALILLLVTLSVALVKNREFWFGSDDTADVETVTPVSPAKNVAPSTVPNVPAASKGVSAPVAKKSEVVAKSSAASEVSSTSVIAGTPTEVPPMEVEVVAGDSHRAVRPGSNSVLVVMPTTSTFHPASATAFKWTPVTNAAERTRIPSEPEYLEEATYPSLAREMKVKGSVLLQASVGADGGIRNLRVLSGNPILTSAAKEAARQWRFRPYLQNGQPVPAQQQITVNFTIKVL